MKFTEDMIAEDEKRWHARDVVTELGYCSNYMVNRKNMTNLDIRFYAYIMRKAQNMLKTYSPHVLTLDELMGFDGAFLIEYNPSMLMRNTNWAMLHFMDEKMVHIWRPRMIEHFSREQYGRTWRCWSSRPTDEQMEAMAWGSETG